MSLSAKLPNSQRTVPDSDVATTDSLLEAAVSDLAAVDTPHQLNTIKARYLGRSGVLQQRLRHIGQLPKDQRARAGAVNNALRLRLEGIFEDKKHQLDQIRAQEAINKEQLDTTLPGRCRDVGAQHPLQQMMDRAVAIFSTIGFEVAEGPEIEADYYNFTALNIPPNHPARAMHDTLYLRDGDWLLRTHTSPVQVRYMEARAGKMPVRIVSPGRVYRRDNDATHSPMFHQIEGLWVDDRACFTDLKGILGSFFRAFFEDDNIEVRFRPSFFPFTDPSAECDMRHSADGDWLEIAGCGMVHPNVLAAAGLDVDQYQGFAFGMGVERLAMLYYGIDDIRLFFENDLRFLAQFSR